MVHEARPRFNPGQFLPREWFDAITQVRVERPAVIRAEAQARQRRTRVSLDGRLALLAADQPGRKITHVGPDPLRMGNRWEYLSRIVRVLLDSAMDGLMATPDIIEDVLILQRLVREAGGPPFLDGKLLIGSMNRGGLAGTSFELDDTFTAYSAAALREQGLDGGKLMFRLDPDSPDAARTVLSCARAVSELARSGLPAFLEPLAVHRTEKGWAMTMTPEALIPVIAVAQALGETSAYTWLKVPMVPDFARVALSTTLPILVLGGDSHGETARLLSDIAAVMGSGAQVRGALMGRNILFPGDRDPQLVARAVSRVVRGAPAAEAAAEADGTAGGQAAAGLDFFTRLDLRRAGE
jgi:hypothetical protein